MKPVITDSILYVGANDTTLDLFESQYPVPEGVSYNSYVILDEKTAIMDTADIRATDEWLQNVKAALGERKADYLIVSHMEPDHAANIKRLADTYPDMVIVGNQKTFHMIPQFFDLELKNRTLTVKEGDTLSLGTHTLTFYMAPMVHWPEVMVTYEQSEKILFSADGFGKFGALSENPDSDSLPESWLDEARRYYLNIVGKYGASVQGLLKKAAGLSISIICPLHGPILKDNLGYYLDKYNTWSSYVPEKKGVLVAFASIHGNTAKAAEKFARLLKEAGEETVVVKDLSRTEISENVADAFCYDKIVLAAASYDGGLFPPMEEFLLHLKSKNFQSRTVGIIENGTWAPVAGKKMQDILKEMKNMTILVPAITIMSTLSDENITDMQELAKLLAEN